MSENGMIANFMAGVAMADRERADRMQAALTVDQLQERVRRTLLSGPSAEITIADRNQMAVALVIQGYDLSRAHRMAFEILEDNDGALQMLARHRAAETERCARIVGNVMRFDVIDLEQQERAHGWRSAQAYYAAAIRNPGPKGQSDE